MKICKGEIATMDTMKTIMEWNGIINGFVWGAPVLILLVGTGVWLTFLLGLPQLRYFFSSLAEVFSFRKKGEGDNSISSFAAMATALHLAGPGALVWMLISALFGMCTKFSEVTLAVHFRKKDAHGDWRGGTMYILEHGLGDRGGAWKFIGKLLAIIFALFAFLASFGIGAATQANSAAEALSQGWGIDHLYSGIAIAVLVALVIIGGLNRLSVVTTYLVPFMAIFYIVGSIIVLKNNAAHIPEAISEAFRLAFNNPGSTITGGLAGWAVKEAVQRGIARGVFSNEAGMGSAPMVHATANVEHPVQQGLYGIFEVFMDTIVICTMTALVILTAQLPSEEYLTATIKDMPRDELVAFVNGIPEAELPAIMKELPGDVLPSAVRGLPGEGLSAEDTRKKLVDTLKSKVNPDDEKSAFVVPDEEIYPLVNVLSRRAKSPIMMLFTGSRLTLKSFEIVLGEWGKYILSIGLLCFAFSTILGWYWYAETAAAYLLGVWFKPVMKVIWIVLILFGAAGARLVGSAGSEFLGNIWDISDTLNGLMALPNLIGLLLLSFVLRDLVKEYDEKRRRKEL